MMNQVFLIGKFKRIEKEENNNYLIIEVLRNFKNENGKYDADNFKIKISENIKNTITNIIQENDKIGVKGTLYKEGNNIVISGDRVTYLQGGEK